MGILTVGVVTKPFQFEGTRRMRLAESGITELQKCVDTLIIIPNQNLFRVANEQTTFADAFAMADRVLYSGVACITDLMVKEGLINLDFADVRAVMREMGKAMMGTGEASGEKRALRAAEAAIANPLLDDVSMRGARGLLISITGGADLTLYEVDEAATRIREEVDQEANVIFGATRDDSLEGIVRVSVVATGIDHAEMMREKGMPQIDTTARYQAGLQDQARLAAQQAEIEQAQRGGDYAKASELQYGKLPDLERKIREREQELESLQQAQRMLKEQVDEEDIAEVVAKWTNIPVSRLMEGEVQKLIHMEERLHERVVGQDEAIRAVANAIRRARAGLQDANLQFSEHQGHLVLEDDRRPGQAGDRLRAAEQAQDGDQRYDLRRNDQHHRQQYNLIHLNQ